uniref:Uncharacterized protein n=1 Tax=Myoviridae sp. ctAca11 TaxID=2825043 RepID=A0A8S5Q6X0_9CAUD|nr:MAG TPA: hypothetical protein [Myoviridae sp. ctAca11]
MLCRPYLTPPFFRYYRHFLYTITTFSCCQKYKVFINFVFYSILLLTTPFDCCIM